MLDAGALSLVVRAGAGVQHDRRRRRPRAAASTCRTVPGRTRSPSPNWRFGLILALDRRIPDNVAELRAGTWNKKEYSKARGLYGRTLGLIGFGNIGQEVAVRAPAFGMPVVAWSRRFDQQPPTSAHGVEDAFGIAVVDSAEEVAAARRHAERAPRARRRTPAAS